MKNKLAILGASYLQLPLVLKAKEMDIETHCFAWSDGAICRNYCDYFHDVSVTNKEAILKICIKYKINGITTIATDLPMTTISYIAKKMGLVGNSEKTAMNSTHKAIMRSCFEENNVSSPKFLEVSNKNIKVPDNFKLPLIVKPVDRSGSRGISKVEIIDDLENAINFALNESIVGKAIIEEFIEGPEVSVEAISWMGKHFILAVTDKVTTGAPHFVELEHHQPSSLTDENLKKIRQTTLKGLNAVGINYGASHTELKLKSNYNPYIVEVGGRMGGDFIGSDLVPISTGYDYLKGVIEVALNTFHEPIIQHNGFSGVYFLSENTAELSPYFGSDNKFDYKKDLQNTILKIPKNSNDRSGYLIYQSDRKVELL